MGPSSRSSRSRRRPTGRRRPHTARGSPPGRPRRARHGRGPGPGRDEVKGSCLQLPMVALDHVWATEAARRVGLTREAERLAAGGASVLVVGLFAAALDDLVGALQGHAPLVCRDVFGQAALRPRLGQPGAISVALASALPRAAPGAGGLRGPPALRSAPRALGGPGRPVCDAAAVSSSPSATPCAALLVSDASPRSIALRMRLGLSPGEDRRARQAASFSGLRPGRVQDLYTKRLGPFDLDQEAPLGPEPRHRVNEALAESRFHAVAANERSERLGEGTQAPGTNHRSGPCRALHPSAPPRSECEHRPCRRGQR
jgi:hypothetical protein